MDDETRRVFLQTAKAIRNTAQANENTAQALLDIAGATAPSQRNDGGRDGGRGSGERERERRDRVRRRRLTVGLLAIGVVLLIIALWPSPPPEPFYGIDGGLVFARCDQPMLGVFHPSIELWAVDPYKATVIDDGHTAVDLPRTVAWRTRATVSAG